MPPRRHVPSLDDQAIDDDYLDEVPELEGDAPPGTPGPVTVCLACGQCPPRGGDCPHESVAYVERPSEALLAAAKRLQAAAQVRRQQERTLRALASRDVASGGEIVSAAERPSSAAPPAPSPCPRCGFPEAEAEAPAPPPVVLLASSEARPEAPQPPPSAGSRRARKKPSDESQFRFFFAEAPTEPAPAVAPAEPPADAAETTAPPPTARRRRGRKPRAGDEAVENVSEAGASEAGAGEARASDAGAGEARASEARASEVKAGEALGKGQAGEMSGSSG